MIPCRKVPHATQEEAQKQLKRLLRRSDVRAPQLLNTYFHPSCGWHVGHNWQMVRTKFESAERGFGTQEIMFRRNANGDYEVLNMQRDWELWQKAVESVLSAQGEGMPKCKCGHWLTEHTHTPTEYLECNREECECAGFNLGEGVESSHAPEGGDVPTLETLISRARILWTEQKRHIADSPIDDAWITDFAGSFAHTELSRRAAHPTSESGTDGNSAKETRCN